MEDNIKGAVKRLQNHLYGIPSWMQVEHLKGCLAEARKEEADLEKVSSK